MIAQDWEAFTLADERLRDDLEIAMLAWNIDRRAAEYFGPDVICRTEFALQSHDCDLMLIENESGMNDIFGMSHADDDLLVNGLDF